MADDTFKNQNDNGYVDLERVYDGEVPPETPADAVVAAHMPEDEAIENEKMKKDLGLGRDDEGVIIDDTTDRLARYDDNDEPQYYDTNYLGH